MQTGYRKMKKGNVRELYENRKLSAALWDWSNKLVRKELQIKKKIRKRPSTNQEKARGVNTTRRIKACSK